MSSLFFQGFKRPSVNILTVFAVSFLIIVIQLYFLEKETPYADNITYMAVAMPLLENGVYEDGNFKNTVLPPGPNKEGMFFAPLYPAFLTGLIWASDDLKRTFQCSIDLIRPDIIEKQCPLNFTVLWVVQSLLGALSAVFIWLTALTLFNRKDLAYLATFLVVTLGTLAYYASIVMAEALILPLFYMSCYFLILSWQEKKILWAALTGLMTGALILTKPSFLYLVYAMSFAFFGLGIFLLLKNKGCKTLQLLVVTVIAICAVTGPWVYRNHIILDHTAITFGYGPFTLSQRVAYNDMNWDEWWVSWIYGIPKEGDNLAKKLFAKDSYRRWSWDDPESFYQYGNQVLRKKTLEEAGSHEKHLSYLLKNYVLSDLPKHIIVTFPLIFRGMWVFELWIFFPYIAFLFLAYKGFRKRKYDYILYSIPPWFMLGLHGFATVNIPRYNIILQASLGMALAWALLKVWEKQKHRLLLPWRKNNNPLH